MPHEARPAILDAGEHLIADREWKIRRLVDADILGIFIWNFEGAIVGANESFLLAREGMLLWRLGTLAN
jgi:hypothetical protein